MTLPAPETSPAPFTLTLFGPMRALVAGQPLPPVHSRKSLWLLALLALRQGRPVEREWLAGTLWPDADQDQAFASLRPVLSDLRRALGAEAGRLQSPSRHALCLELSGTDVDVLAFDAAMTRKSPESLAQAVSLYTGPLLEGCAEEWVPQERNAREEDCLQALAILTDAALAAGEYSRATEYSRRAVALDPWRDGARRRLMEALSRGGDTNAALQVYREFITLLRSDPKAAPDPETSALYSRLRAEAKPRAAASPVAAAEGSAPVVSGYLPHPLTDLIGREDERLEVAAKLQRSRLVTLAGPGGIGKTRLALAIAAEVVSEFADGVWLVSLESLADEARLEGQIASVLGLKETPGQSWRESLTQHLRAKRLLLVLDNCEHVLAASAQIAEYLLDRCGSVRMLATSREVLGITGETAWRVPSLASPDPMHLPTGKTTLVRVLLGYESVQLFVQRAQAAHQEFALTGDNAAAVAQICSRLEGIPLAIELAAARVRAQTVEQIAARLENHLSLLTSGSRTASSRQQTLRRTLDWSYNLLDEAERLLLERLSVFAGGWHLEAAERVCIGAGLEMSQVQDLLMELVNKSLVVFDQQAVGGRYRFLEMVRQYAAEQLTVHHASDLMRARHSAWAAAYAEEIEPQLSGGTKEIGLRRLDADYDNLRTALDFSLADFQGAETGLRIAGVLRHFWYNRGRCIEGRDYLRRALERQDPALRTPVRAKALLALSILSYILSEYEAANTLAEESLTIYRTLGDRRGIASCLHRLGSVEFERGNLAAAQSLHEECLAIKRELEDISGIGSSVFSLGMICQMRGDFTTARKLFEESASIDRKQGDMGGLGWSLYQLAMTRRSQGATSEAKMLIEEGLSIFRELKDQRGIGFFVLYLGDLAFDDGEFAAARSYFEESLSIARKLNENRSISWALFSLGRSLVSLNDCASAEPLIEESLNIFKQIEDRRGEARAIQLQGKIAHKAGDLVSARRNMRQSLAMSQELGEIEQIALTLFALVSVLFVQANVSDAVLLSGAIEGQRAKDDSSMSGLNFKEWRQQIAEARSLLGEETFNLVWEEGRALSLEQAVVYALEAE